MTLLKQSIKKINMETNAIQSKCDKIIIDKGKRDECTGNNENLNKKIFHISENIEKILIIKSSEFSCFDMWKCLKFGVLLCTLCSGLRVNAGIIRDDEDLGPCLLGNFTQVQSWVQEDGSLSPKLSKSLFKKN